MKTKLFGREPAVWLGLIAAAIQLFCAFVFPLSIEAQGALNAIAVAVIGVITATQVEHEKLLPAIAGLIQAAIACGVAFGWDIAPENQAAIMAFVSALGAAWLRTQVVAPRHSAVTAAHRGES